jgi:hypothetical protein
VKGETVKYVKVFKIKNREIMLAEKEGKMVFLYFDKCEDKCKAIPLQALRVSGG